MESPEKASIASRSKRWSASRSRLRAPVAQHHLHPRRAVAEKGELPLRDRHDLRIDLVEAEDVSLARIGGDARPRPAR